MLESSALPPVATHAAKGEGASAEIGEKRLIARVSNALAAFGRWAYRIGKKGAGTAADKIIAHDVVEWALGKETIIGAFLKLVQGGASGWFDTALAIARVWLKSHGW